MISDFAHATTSDAVGCVSVRDGGVGELSSGDFARCFGRFGGQCSIRRNPDLACTRCGGDCDFHLLSPFLSFSVLLYHKIGVITRHFADGFLTLCQR
jgi:hypothetical protein